MQNRKRDTDVQKDFWTLWEKARVGCFERTAVKYIYYLGWNRSPAQAGCMRQVLGPGALGKLVFSKPLYFGGLDCNFLFISDFIDLGLFFFDESG